MNTKARYFLFVLLLFFQCICVTVLVCVNHVIIYLLFDAFDDIGGSLTLEV